MLYTFKHKAAEWESVGVSVQESAHASVGSLEIVTLKLMKSSVTTMNAGKNLDVTKMVIGAMTVNFLTVKVGNVNPIRLGVLNSPIQVSFYTTLEHFLIS